MIVLDKMRRDNEDKDPPYLMIMAMKALAYTLGYDEHTIQYMPDKLQDYQKVFGITAMYPVGDEIVERSKQMYNNIEKLITMRGEISEVEFCELIFTIIDIENSKIESTASNIFNQLLAGFAMVTGKR